MPAGAPFGNQNARKGRLWNQALERALAKRGKGDMIAALDELAEKFLDTVEEMTFSTEKRGPSIAGFSELADRLDGKSSQSVELTAEITNHAAQLSDEKLAEIAANAGNRDQT
jgi:uncharacterized coiled-coil DUF342 family protein